MYSDAWVYNSVGPFDRWADNCLLTKTLKDANFIHLPESFVLPAEAEAMKRRMAQAKDAVWVVRRCSSLGSVNVTFLTPTADWRRYGGAVVQKYVQNPLTYLGRKFDITAWVVVSGWRGRLPTIWLARAMMARVAPAKYNRFSELSDVVSTSDEMLPLKSIIRDGYDVILGKMRKLASRASADMLATGHVGPPGKKARRSPLVLKLYSLDAILDVESDLWFESLNPSPAMSGAGRQKIMRPVLRCLAGANLPRKALRSFVQETLSEEFDEIGDWTQ